MRCDGGSRGLGSAEQRGLLRRAHNGQVLRDVVEYLTCGVCGRAVSLAEGAVRCDGGHSFDVARQGYVSMLAGRRSATGDTGEMVAARERFLAAGHLAPLGAAVARAAAEAAGPGLVVDAGAGTGHYLAGVLDALPDRRGVALDASTAALRRAARCHPRAAAVACDVWARIPVRTGAAGIVLDVFAPRNGDEMHRVLAPSGALVVATPTRRHLRELVDALGLLQVDERKDERVAGALGSRFEQTASVLVEHEVSLGRGDVADAVAMGPSARHVAPDVARLSDPFPVTVSVEVTTYAPRP